MNLEDLMARQSAEDGQDAKISPLKSLKGDLDFYSESIQEVAHEMLDEGYTAYPIFIAHQHEVHVGEVLLDRLELNTQWSIQVSSLAEFVEKGLIKADREAFFVKNFKDPKDFMCLFVVVPEGANFVFYPYK